MAEITISEFPVQYLEALDKVLTVSSFAAKYNVTGVEFVNAKTVKIPSITFSDKTLKNYKDFSTNTPAELKYESLTLANDKESSFKVDAVDDMDTAHTLTTNLVSEYERSVLVPEIDKSFFSTALAKANAKGTDELSHENIVAAIRKARAQFIDAGLSGGDLFMSSDAISALEDAINRQFAGENNITDTVGMYDGFNVYVVPKDRMEADFIAIPKNAVFKGIKTDGDYFCWDETFNERCTHSGDYYNPVPDDTPATMPWDYRQYIDDKVVLPPMEYKSEQTQEEIRAAIKKFADAYHASLQGKIKMTKVHLCNRV